MIMVEYCYRSEIACQVGFGFVLISVSLHITESIYAGKPKDRSNLKQEIWGLFRASLHEVLPCSVLHFIWLGYQEYWKMMPPGKGWESTSIVFTLATILSDFCFFLASSRILEHRLFIINFCVSVFLYYVGK